MAGISAYDSNSISILFSGMNGGTRTNSSSPFSMLSASLSDYNLIRSGSYKKLMTSYFSKTDGSAVNQAFANKKTNLASKDSAETLTGVERAAEDLSDSVSDLMKNGSSSVFAKTTKTDESGSTVSSYDTDRIYKAVKEFADNYNELIKAADRSETDGIQKTTVNMINYTSQNEDLLNEIGITVDSENYRLSVDEEKFKGADMNQVKSLFHDTGSYGYHVKAQASMVEYKAQTEASRAHTYTSAGGYGQTYAAGSVWDSFY